MAFHSVALVVYTLQRACQSVHDSARYTPTDSDRSESGPVGDTKGLTLSPDKIREFRETGSRLGTGRNICNGRQNPFQRLFPLFQGISSLLEYRSGKT